MRREVYEGDFNTVPVLGMVDRYADKMVLYRLLIALFRLDLLP